jgi:hypothetical protein
MAESEKRSSSPGAHILGILGVLAVAALVQHLYRVHMIGGGSTESSQWQLGLGLVGGTLVMLLIVVPFRRRLRNGPAKKLEPWMITHGYISLAAATILLHHAFFNFTLDLRGILLSLLSLTIALGVVLLALRLRQKQERTTKVILRLSTYHQVLAVLTGVLLVVHVLFDAVVRH